ncbi:MAG: hypothetical protein IKW00_06825 [Clostridia bacterium]|nr:hypothetical protein [Clostridia bacterium]
MNIKRKLDKLYKDFYDVMRRHSAQKRRIKQFQKLTHPGVLTKEQESKVKAYFSPYSKLNMVFHNFYTEKTGIFCEDYIPQDVYVGYIDPYFNDIRAAEYLDNKCYFGMLYNQIPQPETVIKRINKLWLNKNNEPLTQEQIKSILNNEPDSVFLKEAVTSSGGHGVVYIEKSPDTYAKLMQAAERIPTDLIVQRGVVQHADIAKLNNSSVNTLRIYSVLGLDGNVTVYSSVLRMGVGKAKIDNYSSGGYSCGITKEGKLQKFAYNSAGERIDTHPTSGICFEDYVIPSYDKAISLVKKAHPIMPHFRSVCWDIAICEDGTPVMIEANLCRGGIVSLQLNNGPIYGADTKKILDEVFRK